MRALGQTLALALALISSIPGLQAADDAFVQPREGEILIGPLSFLQPVLDVPVSFRASTFLKLSGDADHIHIDARILADLADLQRQAGAIVDRIPLPVDNCAQRGIDRLNYVVRIRHKQLAAQGELATLGLGGDVAVWSCFMLFGNQVKNRNIEESFTAALPFELEADTASVQLRLRRPDIEFGGDVGRFVESLLSLLGVDLGQEILEILEQVVDLDVLQASVPEKLLALDPAISQVRFMNLAGRLGAELKMRLTLDREAMFRGEIRSLAHAHGG